MAKSATIIVRIDPALKTRLEAAARRRGESVTTFLLKAAEEAARKVEAMSPATMKPKGKGACPTFFLALCHEAKQGGQSGYYAAGHELTGHVRGLLDFDESTEGKLDELQGLIEAQNDERVLAWFERELPRCMKLVPGRRRQSFLRGVYAMVEEDDRALCL